MKKHILSDLWAKFPIAPSNDELSKGYNNPITTLMDIAAVGPYYHYIIEIHTSSIHQVTESYYTIHDEQETPQFINHIIDLIHPDDLDFVVRAEKFTIETINQIGYEHHLNLKCNYCFRMKVGPNKYQLFHHQSLHLNKNDEGIFTHALNIHTNIDHITQVNNFIVSVVGIGERSDYIQKDLSNKPKVLVDAVKLSKREKEILPLIARGLTSPAIADALYISEHTVRTHRKSILQKTNANNSSSLIKVAIELGLL